MDKFLETQPTKTDSLRNKKSLNKFVTSKETELVIKNLPTKKAQDQVASLENSTKHSKMNKHHPLSNPSQKLNRILPVSFCEIGITLIPAAQTKIL